MNKIYFVYYWYYIINRKTNIMNSYFILEQKKKIIDQIIENYIHLQYLNNLTTTNDNNNFNSNLSLGSGTGISIGERNLLAKTKTKIEIEIESENESESESEFENEIKIIDNNIGIYSSFDIPFTFNNISNSIRDIRAGIGLTDKKYVAHNTFVKELKLITLNELIEGKYDANVNINDDGDGFNSKKFSPEYLNKILDCVSSVWSKLNIANNNIVIVMMVDEKNNKFKYTFFRVYTGGEFKRKCDINNIKYTEWRNSNNIT